jgi:hypothetical protein
MAHSDDATKAWVSAIPTLDANSKVRKWDVKYKYTLNSYSYTFDERGNVETPSKAANAYTKAEILSLLPIDTMNRRFNAKYDINTNGANTSTKDFSFDISTLNDS